MGSIAVSQDSLPYAGPKAAKQKAVKSVGKHGVDIIDVRRVAVETNLKDDILSMWNPTNGPRRLPTLLLYNERGLQLFEDITYLEEYYLTNNEIEVLNRSSREIAQNISPESMVIELGSNFERYDAAGFLKHFSDVLAPSDKMLIGLDGCGDPAKVYHAYNDKHGITHEFILNGLTNANEILGQEAFKLKDWEVIGEYVYDDEGGRHQAFFSPVRDTYVLGTLIRQHERIQVEQSLKYSQRGAENLWSMAGLVETGRWTKGDEHGLHMISKRKMPFSLLPYLYASSPCPSLSDWEALWTAWDAVTQSMLPREELLDKPIKLRNACIFYLGHIPGFLDIQLTKTTKKPATEPAHFQPMFERGIDPDVDNPEKCHSHSEIPDEWPAVEEIIEYQRSVRSRLRSLYKDGIDNIPRPIAQGIWVGFEHEIMHMETLLYMMIQSDKTLPPPDVERPDFKRLAQKAHQARVANEWHDVPAQSVKVGMDEPALDAGINGYFGWDNEKPSRRVDVHSFQAKGRPITNEEKYAQYMFENHIEQVPASWADVHASESDIKTNGHTNGFGNGHSNGHTNGHTNGHANGHANGHTNGHVNGNTNGAKNGVNGVTGHRNVSLPDSFLEGMAVRTVYGLVPLKYALDWPIFASYDELSGCAAWMGGRMPSFEEARSIYTYVHNLKKMEAERTLGRTVPAVNGHLSNDGVEETPPKLASLEAEKVRSELFMDLDGANVGFQHWHPVPVTANGGRLAGQGELGGVWEWTSTPLARHEGFEPMPLYPQYTADFFDGKHNIVLGGSWATHPIIAGRRSFVNWYQRNYPYAWAGARIVRDIK
ncbi:hypothetical protein Brms1b_008439 [Colletotrichum noveboracense]|nr:hypothetical protein Brms1b_008439 [Colletotrichum noveboracense]